MRVKVTFYQIDHLFFLYLNIEELEYIFELKNKIFK